MAKARRKSSDAKGGSTLFGLLAGLILGLAAAAAVAIFVTQVPMPFVDKASRDPAQVLLPDVREAPDPNLGLYGENRPGGSAARGPTVTPPSPLPNQGGTNPSMSDEIGQLLATLGAPDPKANTSTAPAPATRGSEPSRPSQPSAPSAPQQPSTPAVVASNQTTYFLQAGAFRSENDAEAVKAQVLMMGLPVQVQKAQVNGSTLYRVRVGPFNGIDEMNRSRSRLGEASIESSVVRP